MHLDKTQEPFYARIYRKKAGTRIEHPDQEPAFTRSVRTPQCGHTVRGIINIHKYCECIHISRHLLVAPLRGTGCPLETLKICCRGKLTDVPQQAAKATPGDLPAKKIRDAPCPSNLVWWLVGSLTASPPKQTPQTCKTLGTGWLTGFK